MDTTTFFWHTAAAAGMGTAIGLERQWGNHIAGLRTNALVAFGAALFVSLPLLLPVSDRGDGIHSQDDWVARSVGQVVVGVGFLGGGVILKEGFNIRGLNTAATLWCSAAVGALTGAGLLWQGLFATVGVLVLNLGLKPVSDWLDRRLLRAKNVATVYRLKAICRTGQEEIARAAIFKFFQTPRAMALRGVSTREGEGPERSCVLAEIYSQRRDDHAMEELMQAVNSEPTVSAVSWENATSA
jgi:putative Mg2+ transporter-C (MgtC) family protein